MPETTVQVAHGLIDIYKWVIGIAVGFLGFNIRRTSAKVDDHDKNHISRKEFNDTVRSARRENREDFKDIHKKIDRLLDK